MKRKGLFPGTFDPFTIAHYDLIQRGLLLMDEIVIAIGINLDKKTLFTLEERIATLEKIYAGENRISVLSYDILTADFAKQLGINFLIRGIRNSIDFEYEKNLAEMNRKLSGIDTVFLFPEPELAYISSSLVRELIIYKKDISNLIPPVK